MIAAFILIFAGALGGIAADEIAHAIDRAIKRNRRVNNIDEKRRSLDEWINATEPTVRIYNFSYRQRSYILGIEQLLAGSTQMCAERSGFRDERELDSYVSGLMNGVAILYSKALHNCMPEPRQGAPGDVWMCPTCGEKWTAAERGPLDIRWNRAYAGLPVVRE